MRSFPQAPSTTPEETLAAPDRGVRRRACLHAGPCPGLGFRLRHPWIRAVGSLLPVPTIRRRRRNLQPGHSDRGSSRHTSRRAIPVWSPRPKASLPRSKRNNPWDTTLTWAFLAWRPTNDLLLRAGRFRVPYYLNSANLDVGVTYDLHSFRKSWPIRSRPPTRPQEFR